MTGKITYALVSNNLTEDDDFYARVLPTRTATLDHVVERIVKLGSTLTRTDILGVVEGFCEAVEDLVLEGATVVTPVANYGVSIKGSFANLGDQFDPDRHHLVAKIHPGTRLRKTIAARGQVERQSLEAIRPQPRDYHDIISGQRNTTVTPGGLGKLLGSRLKFDPADETQGIFFVADDGTRTQVTAWADNHSIKLVFLIPADLAPGSYCLQVVTKHGDNVLHRDNNNPITLTV